MKVKLSYRSFLYKFNIVEFLQACWVFLLFVYYDSLLVELFLLENPLDHLIKMYDALAHGRPVECQWQFVYEIDSKRVSRKGKKC